MHCFQLWLHPVHEVSRPVACTLDQLAVTRSLEDRFALLAATADASSRELSSFPKKATRLELQSNGTLSQARDLCGQMCAIPVMFSQLAFRMNTGVDGLRNSSNPAGFIALGSPLMSAGQVGIDAGNLHSCDVWMLVVTCNFEEGRSADVHDSQAYDAAMREAVAALVRHGAICNSFSGAPFSDAAWTSASLGEGSSADVKLMRFRPPAQRGGAAAESAYAVKMWNESHEDQDMKVFSEVRHLINVQGHPNIGEFVGFFRSDVLTDRPRWLMVMEAYGAGDLQAAVAERGAYAQHEALTLVVSILRALVHVHALDIVHRDVKLENIVLKLDGDAVLVDFGLAVHMSENRERMRICGTPGSIAPETLLGQGCVKKSDVFGCGTVLYGMLGGVVPFVRDDHDSTIRSNCKANVKFPEANFRLVCEDVRAFVRKMLQRHPRRRFSSSDALRMLYEEDERLPSPAPGMIQDVSLATPSEATPQIESTSAVLEAPAIVMPGVVHALSNIDCEADHFQVTTCDASTAITATPPSNSCHEAGTIESHTYEADVPTISRTLSSTWEARAESKEGFNRSASKSSRLASRFVSISRRPFAWVRRRVTDQHGRPSFASDDRNTPVDEDSLAGTSNSAEYVSNSGSFADTFQRTRTRQRGIWKSLRVASAKCNVFRANSVGKTFSSVVCMDTQSPTG